MTDTSVRQVALSLLCGREGGLARSHRGLAAFWQSVADDVLINPASPETRAQLATLDAWLTDGPACALVAGQDPVFRSALLSRWALSVAERRAAEVIFVPVSACFGTAVERDMLKLFVGLFKGSTTAMFSRPRSPGEMISAIRLALMGVGWVSSVPDEENPQLLVVLDGVERAADGWPDPRIPFLSEPGEGARIVVSVDAEGHAPSGMLWRDRLAWAAEEMTLISYPADCPSSDEVTSARRTLASLGEEGALAARVFDALAAILAPVSRDELVRAVGVSLTELEAFERAPDPARRLVVTGDVGAYRFRGDAVHACWAVSDGLAAIEDAIVARGLSALHARTSASEPDIAWPPYLVEYLGAHMTRRCAGVTDFMDLVSPTWLRIWMDRPGGLVGFLTDARRARRAAEDALLAVCGSGTEGDARAEAERSARVCDVVWCALVEGALCAKEGSRNEARDPTEPYTEPTVDLARPTGAARERAEALVTFASLLTGSEQQLVQGWATDACAGLEQIIPRPIPRVATDPSAADPERTRRIRAGATYDEVDEYLSRDMVIRPTDLSPDEAWRLAENRAGESRMVSFAGILPDLPEELRESAVREVMAAYWAHGDRLALRILAACAPWMALADAARVLCNELGNDWTGEYPEMLVGFGGLTELSPLLRRLGGTAALVGAARAIADVGRWLP
ncbi:hypothetical protein [Sorangium cellulosum]|uniref:Uncharacterized protein n=1 Tax=Sorangium cellulosum TaxID=56 RepID=A0A150QFF3_SORCE|nr:hypothetical protein [Sorangium cellulosum]KYF66679.1 hypothetical protein BE15_12600 [Sorangium cellulosum]